MPDSQISREPGDSPGPNALDYLYGLLRSEPWKHLSRKKQKAREADVHQEIRELRSKGMKTTLDPVCNKVPCTQNVKFWGQECDTCADRAPF